MAVACLPSCFAGTHMHVAWHLTCLPAMQASSWCPQHSIQLIPTHPGTPRWQCPYMHVSAVCWKGDLSAALTPPQCTTANNHKTTHGLALYLPASKQTGGKQLLYTQHTARPCTTSRQCSPVFAFMRTISNGIACLLSPCTHYHKHTLGKLTRQMITAKRRISMLKEHDHLMRAAQTILCMCDHICVVLAMCWKLGVELINAMYILLRSCNC